LCIIEQTLFFLESFRVAIVFDKKLSNSPKMLTS
jgi:hypothetical protein